MPAEGDEAVGDVETAIRAVERLERAGSARPAATRLVYRLLLLRLAERRGHPLALEEGLSGVDRCGVPVPLLLEAAGSLEPPDDPGVDLPRQLGRLHERLLAASGAAARKAAGAYFTPQPLIDHLLDRTLEPALEEAADPRQVGVLDPSCGSGLFLVSAARRIARRGVPVAEAVLQVHGIDLDPAAVELARVCLWLEAAAPGRPLRLPHLPLRAGDALLDGAPEERYDVVVGNPPFLNQLERLTVTDRAAALRLDEVTGGARRPYTDLSAVFLRRAVDWVRDGGRVGLVQPQSVLAARDAAGVRRHLAATCSLEHLWASESAVFDAGVLTCALVLRTGVAQGPVTRSHGPAFAPVPARQDPDLSAEWAPLLAAGLGIPEVTLGTASGRLSDIATCTADFRDQYYGLAGAVHEAADLPTGVPLVTSGLVQPAWCRWGERPARFHKRRWQAPVVDVAALRGTPLERWAGTRLVPKVLVGTQGPVVEAVADPGGGWLPSVPTITATAPADRLWWVLAVLLAPPVSAYAATRYAGTALSMRAIKLSARQVGALPLPGDRAAWGEGARLAELAQTDSGRRAEHLLAMGEAMCRGYGVGAGVLDWWADRARLARPGS
jgi:hypothetical protein